MLVESPTLMINRLVQEEQRKGRSLFNFSAGDPLLPLHPMIAEGARKALLDPLSPYPLAQGDKELCSLAASWMNRRYQTSLESDQLLITSGGKAALWMALTLFLAPQDKVFLPAPYWVSYPQLIALSHASPIVIPTSAEKGWKICPQQLEELFEEGTKILILNNANNPTGVLYTRDELLAILQTAKKLGLIVLSDEVYSELCYEDEHPFISCSSFKEYQEQVITVQSFSKNFALPGWRIGFLVASKERVLEATKLQGQILTGVSRLSQEVAKAALLHDESVIHYVKTEMRERRDLFIERYNDLFGVNIPLPPSGLYLFAPISHLKAQKGEGSALLAQRYLTEYSVASIPGEAFGQAGFLRFSFSASKETIEKAFDHLKRLL